MSYRHKKQLSLYETKDHSDCTFIFPNEKIKAHKLLLSLCSPVFERMFYGTMSCNEILIEDIEPLVFNKFLQYIYTNTIQIDSVLEAWNLFYLCQKYFLLDLQDQCLNYVQHNLSISNLLMCYEYAMLYGQEKLSQQCLDDIRIFSKGLLLCNHYHPQLETIRTLTQNESLEIALLTVNWAIVELQVNQELMNNTSSITAIASLIKEHKIQIRKHYVDPLFYKALDREQQDVVEVYNDLVMNSLMMRPTARKPKYKFKYRAEFKNCYRLPIRNAEILSPRVCCTCDCMLFGATIATKSKPQHVTDNDYMGGVSIYVYLKDNERISNMIYKYEARNVFLNYDDVQHIVFDVPVLCTAYVSYMICVKYTAETHGESVLLTYMSDKLTSNSNKSKSVICFGDEENGAVIKGLCFYEV